MLKWNLAKMTSKYDDIRREARFCGTYQELRKIIAAEKNGAWQDLGLAKKFTSTDYEEDYDDDDDGYETDRDESDSDSEITVWDMSITWWSDTGDLLFSYNLDEYYFWNPLGHRQDKKHSRAGQRWAPLKTEKARETSLPELFFKDPMAFYSRYEKKEFGPKYENEAAEIVNKSRCISSPRTLTRNASIVHRFGPGNEYLGFHVNAKRRVPERSRGEEIISHCIDMRLPYIWNGGAKSGADLLAVSLMREFDRTSTRVWNRKGCEEFFNAAELFGSC